MPRHSGQSSCGTGARLLASTARLDSRSRVGRLAAWPTEHNPNIFEVLDPSFDGPRIIVRVLFLADSHLGFDLPTRPRVRRRRRGHDFQANHERALSRALDGDVDLVVHGGDVFHRSRVAPSLAHEAFAPMRVVADAGVPVFIVPGNHERSRIPHARFASHPLIHIFDRPRAFEISVQDRTVAIGGFPYVRRNVRQRFPMVLDETGIRASRADVRLLALHHCVEGATVGPSDFVFRGNDDVVRGRDIPGGVAAVLSGHIHRHQVLTHDLSRRTLAAPVFYPGSVERTSIAEKDEEKGYLILNIEPGSEGGVVRDWSHVPLPARPMITRELQLDDSAPSDLVQWFKQTLDSIPRDAVLRIRIQGRMSPERIGLPTAAELRQLAPESMNVDIVVLDNEGRRVLRTAPPSADSDVGPEQSTLAL